MNFLEVKGARAHNLKNIYVKFPKNKLVVFTGVSGSGKSSLAFDTIYAEGQRRYVESLSNYARQFLEQLAKPDVDFIHGLSPAIAIEQRTAGGSLRSIVATQTEIYDYLRLFFARIGKPHCFKCGKLIRKITIDEIVRELFNYSEGTKIQILAPIIRGKKGEYSNLFARLLNEGFVRVRVDKKIYGLEEEILLKRYQTHNIEIVVDRVVISQTNKTRITDSVETALKYGKGLVLVVINQDTEKMFNSNLACPDCSVTIEEIEPRIFSFNSPYGACPDCNGLGTTLKIDPDLVVPEKERSLAEGAIAPWRRGRRGYVLYYRSMLKQLAYELGIDWHTPFKKIPKKIQDIILYGSENIQIWDKPYQGVIPILMRIFKESESSSMKEEITQYMTKLPCPSCKGARLKKESLSVLIKGKSIWDITQMTIEQALDFFKTFLIQMSFQEKQIAENIIKEIIQRLQFCCDVGIGYLTLDRLSFSLSGGEAQRIRLATQVGSALSGVLYVLDEPTIGLHPHDNDKLIRTLKRLRDLNNTVIVVEHDQEVINNSDWIVDLGPGAGRYGGEIVFSGPLGKLKKCKKSLTAEYISGRKKIALPVNRRPLVNCAWLEIKGACEHNLKNINVRFPLGRFSCVTGVSGSGKSTLVHDILYRALAQHLYNSKEKPGSYKSINGIEYIDKVIIVDQDPIGRTPRSNPATYTGVFTYIRELFSKLPDARARGYKPGRFSFNIPGGRCEACNGEGDKKIEMHFLPDIYIPCEICNGKRFNEQTLQIRFKGKNIADVLSMDVSYAYGFFENFPQIRNILQTLLDVGLGYISLGQPATTLSGGEAQRIKLAAHLRRRASGKTVYIFDEPTTGLHFDDVDKLLKCFYRLVDKGNTVIVIEHNFDIVKCADYIVDLGPLGGDKGGRIVAAGSPEEIVKNQKSYTGAFLKKYLNEKV